MLLLHTKRFRFNYAEETIQMTN
uniref:Uncharacterized protein n=1 Tax=Arundo donax TaxID=35708 RepID=A0A0A9BJ98_ARUDO